MVDQHQGTDEKLFALVFASNLCWSAQSGAGKRHKHLVYFTQKNDTTLTMADFWAQLNEQLQRLSLIDEQHRVYGEYRLMVRCHCFRTAPLESKKTNEKPQLVALQTDKLSQCAMIDAVKMGYNLSGAALSCHCLAEQRGQDQPTTPLFFDDVVRLLQFYAHIQPLDSLINALEGADRFTYVRIVVMSENDILSLFHALRHWIVAMDDVHVSQVTAQSRSSKPRKKNEQSNKPRIVDCKKRKMDPVDPPLRLVNEVQPSVRAICAKLKNQLFEQTMEANSEC